MPQQYGSGGSGWAALAAALQGLGQGFQIKRDLDDRDRERARQEAEDRQRQAAADLQREAMLLQIMEAKDAPGRQAYEDYVKQATTLPPDSSLLNSYRDLPEKYQTRARDWGEYTPASQRPTLASRALTVDLPPSPVDTPAPDDVVGQALASRPPIQVARGPLQEGTGSTEVPEQLVTRGTANAQIAAAREQRLQEAQAAASDYKTAQAEWMRERASIEREKIKAQTALSQVMEQGRNSRQGIALAQQAQQYLTSLDVRIQQGNANLQAKQQALRLAAERASKSGSDPMSLFFLSQMGGEAPEPKAPMALEPLPQLTMPAGAPAQGPATAPPAARRRGTGTPIP